LLQGRFPQGDDLPGLGLLFGAVGGAGVALLVLLVRAVSNPLSEAPTHFTSINGIGSTLYGKFDPSSDGSYITTEWFTILFIPIFPVCSYRVIKTGGTLFSGE
jgi:hypothetical protein